MTVAETKSRIVREAKLLRQHLLGVEEELDALTVWCKDNTDGGGAHTRPALRETAARLQSSDAWVGFRMIRECIGEALDALYMKIGYLAVLEATHE